MSLPAINTWQATIEDTTPPVLSGVGASAYAFIGTNIVIHGLSANDNQYGNVSASIVADSAFIADSLSSSNVLFFVSDRWGNKSQLSLSVEVIEIPIVPVSDGLFSFPVLRGFGALDIFRIIKDPKSNINQVFLSSNINHN